MEMCKVSRKRKQIIKMKSVFVAIINFKGHKMRRMRSSHLYKTRANECDKYNICLQYKSCYANSAHALERTEKA